MTMIQQPGQLGKWEHSKKLAGRVARTMRRVSDPRLVARADRMADCGDVIEYQVCPHCGRAHVASVRLCRDRLCPVCSWRLARKRAGEAMTAMRTAHSMRPDLACAMLTLTVANCTTANLRRTLAQMLQGWDRLLKRRGVKRAVVGWTRSVEVKRAADGEHWHPHLHVLLLMPREALRRGGELRIEQAQWADMWAQSMSLPYTPIVDIRRAYVVRGGRRQWDDMLASAVEACKYAVKADEVAELGARDLADLADAIKGVRLLAYGGLLRRIRSDLRMAEEDAPPSAEAVEQCPQCGACDPLTVTYAWGGRDYRVIRVIDAAGQAVRTDAWSPPDTGPGTLWDASPINLIP